jgi:hypothetical protein
MARPKKKPPADTILAALVERDGRHCYLCGIHHRNDTNLGVDMIEYRVDTDSLENFDHMENLFLACTSCIRRRSRKPFLQYMQERLKFSKAETDYINAMFHPKHAEANADTRDVVALMRKLHHTSPPIPDNLRPKPKVLICADMSDGQLYDMTLEEIDALDPEGDHERHEVFRRHHMAKAGDALMRHYLLTRNEDGTISRVYNPQGAASHARGTEQAPATFEAPPKTIEDAHAAARALLDRYGL